MATVTIKPMPVTNRHLRERIQLDKQRGAIMLITLIALSLIMLSAMGLIRSFDTSLSMAGNLAFKRDLVNQGERGMAKAITLFNSGALSTTAAREANSLSNNYSATMLATDPHGIPLKLINNTTFLATPAMTAAADFSDSTTGITVRYVIDRLCATAGKFDNTSCVSLKSTAGQGGSATLAASKVGQEYMPVYRISVRVTGPRNTQSYLQTTITR